MIDYKERIVFEYQLKICDSGWAYVIVKNEMGIVDVTDKMNIIDAVNYIALISSAPIDWEKLG